VFKQFAGIELVFVGNQDGMFYLPFELRESVLNLNLRLKKPYAIPGLTASGELNTVTADTSSTGLGAYLVHLVQQLPKTG
jgi:hypothetical protein